MEHPWLIKNTIAQNGRYISITPEKTDLEYLSVGRIRLDSGADPVTVGTEENETSLICLHGKGTITVDGQTYDVAPCDGVYIPRDNQFTVEADGNLDLVECIAPVTRTFPPAQHFHPLMCLFPGQGRS